MTETSLVESPIGLIKIKTTKKGVSYIGFLDEMIKPSVDITNIHSIRAKDQLDKYFKGELKKFSLELDLEGTEFQNKVWNALSQIPYGETISYSKQASLVGDCNATRAVASANGKNPIAIVNPCHRVIGKNGELRGYEYGVKRKQFLLNLEKDFFLKD